MTGVHTRHLAKLRRFCQLAGVLICFSTSAFSQDVNFELGLGHGTQGDWEVYDLDLRVNMALSDTLGSQFSINSDYFFAGKQSQDFAQSVVLFRGFARVPSGRVSVGLGNVQRKLRFGDTLDETYFIESSGAIYHGKWTAMVDYRDADQPVGNAIRSRRGLIYYPDVNRSIEIYHINTDGKTNWRFATYVQPIEYRQQTSIGLVVEDGERENSPQLDLIVTYYFDRALTLKDRRRQFH